MQSGIRLAFFGGPPYLFLYLFSHLAVLMLSPSPYITSLSDSLPGLFMYWPHLGRGMVGWAPPKKQPREMTPPVHLVEGEKREMEI